MSLLMAHSMSAKKDYSQLSFTLEILRILSQRSINRDDLANELATFVENFGQPAGDVHQKLTRTIRKLRDCGFEINSAPNRPYELVTSNFPVIITPDQRDSLAMAAYVLDDMGFSAQASHLLQLAGLTENTLPNQLKVNFSPPVDYGEDRLNAIVKVLQQRFQQRRRYVIRYRSSRGSEKNWDLDRSELRLHNGILYLFAHAPDFSARHHRVEKNQIFRVDRIVQMGPASEIPWGIVHFPTIELSYRMSGPLGTYQPRRANEKVVDQDQTHNPPSWVEIATIEESLFWFRQRLLKYGENIRLLTPPWFVKRIAAETQRMAQNYAPITKV